MHFWINKFWLAIWEAIEKLKEEILTQISQSTKHLGHALQVYKQLADAAFYERGEEGRLTYIAITYV